MYLFRSAAGELREQFELRRDEIDKAYRTIFTCQRDILDEIIVNLGVMEDDGSFLPHDRPGILFDRIRTESALIDTWHLGIAASYYDAQISKPTLSFYFLFDEKSQWAGSDFNEAFQNEAQVPAALVAYLHQMNNFAVADLQLAEDKQCAYTIDTYVRGFPNLVTNLHMSTRPIDGMFDAIWDLSQYQAALLDKAVFSLMNADWHNRNDGSYHPAVEWMWRKFGGENAIDHASLLTYLTNWTDDDYSEMHAGIDPILVTGIEYARALPPPKLTLISNHERLLRRMMGGPGPKSG